MYQFGDDTIIGGKSYKRMMADGIYYTSYLIACREDTTTKQSFIYDESSEQEYILYDFSLNVNDDFGSYQVDSIDSVTLVNGEVRRRLHLSSFMDWREEYWIEGIGSTRGLFFRCDNTVDWDWQLSCFTENDTLKYQNTDFPVCDYDNPNHITELGDKNALMVFPNPTSSGVNITIAHNFDKPTQIEIFNALGQKLTQLEFRTQIDLSEYDSGLYLIVVINDQGQCITARIVKE
jgi:hypothetical protein